MICQIQEYWRNLKNKRIKLVSEEFQISKLTAKKYINMTEEEIQKLNNPANYKKRTTIMDEYINIIFKMQRDGINDDLIYFYILKHGYSGNQKSLWNYIYCIEKNNFPDRTPMNPKCLIEWSYPDDVIIIKRNSLLKYLLTKNPKTKKDETIGKYINELIEKYRDSSIASFCNGIERDIAPIKNAISLKVSSGFVEGNNNKFKLIKRIVYGKSGLVNLAKKCFLAFLSKRPSFNLVDLI
ncbi:transposase [Clostridium sp. AWRP]|uniref:transposase n=1 Tax=Clostridium sp. AWRP TaxID=2212991 RepID=UPI001FAAB8B0|nr:transposase [Clostridium sp. AWRP]